MRVLLVASLLLTCSALQAQQVADTAYRFNNPDPTYAPGNGPVVCIDGGHGNFHTIDGRYRPFADLVEGDGFVARGVDGDFDAQSLAGCKILVTANPLAEEERAPAHLPRGSAFSAEEIDVIVRWVRNGGGLFLIADHPPWPGATRDLASLFGVVMLNGFAVAAEGAPPGPTPFGDRELVPEADWHSFGELLGFPTETTQLNLENSGELGDHPILRGRKPSEAVELVVTFQGHAFLAAEDVRPLLIWGPDAIAGVIVQRDVELTEWPVFKIGGWLQAAARSFGEGRVVVLGEAASCSAQLAGGRLRAGINAPVAPHNAQFCLNIVRWLAGALLATTSANRSTGGCGPSAVREHRASRGVASGQGATRSGSRMGRS